MKLDKPLVDLVFKIKLMTYVHAQMRAYIALGAEFKMKEIFADFRSYHSLTEREYPGSFLHNTLRNAETQTGTLRPSAKAPANV